MIENMSNVSSPGRFPTNNASPTNVKMTIKDGKSDKGEKQTTKSRSKKGRYKITIRKE